MGELARAGAGRPGHAYAGAAGVCGSRERSLFGHVAEHYVELGGRRGGGGVAGGGRGSALPPCSYLPLTGVKSNWWGGM